MEKDTVFFLLKNKTINGSSVDVYGVFLEHVSEQPASSRQRSLTDSWGIKLLG